MVNIAEKSNEFLHIEYLDESEEEILVFIGGDNDCKQQIDRIGDRVQHSNIPQILALQVDFRFSDNRVYRCQKRAIPQQHRFVLRRRSVADILQRG